MSDYVKGTSNVSCTSATVDEKEVRITLEIKLCIPKEQFKDAQSIQQEN